ncbi:cobalt ECF transporter T component CbiQ [Shewanella benthica]|uniref:Cobalt transport protein n=1 Tax=Shewanella benthica KT99 TaxID=314608 RepID=A9DDV2_9GAMM|nr:cobalt ECF transporter T component CbiQ [Shewanella benthica]EDQ00177.1 Cobalt transport protein [Shewanella benthica KT99]
MIETLLNPKVMAENSILVSAKLRVLLMTCVAFAVVLTQVWLALGLFFILVSYLWCRSGLSISQTGKRLLAMDCLVLFTVLLIPFSVPGEPVFSIIGFGASEPGIKMAMMILLKANIVMLAVMALSAGIDAITLGKVLVELGVPRRFALLMQFTVRYIEVLYLEFYRLRQAMKIRGFKPGNNMHTWRSYGYLFGVLLVRAFDRADRISQAMRCRGFRGHFLSHEPSRVPRCDFVIFFSYLLVICFIFCSSFWSFNPSNYII